MKKTTDDSDANEVSTKEGDDGELLFSRVDTTYTFQNGVSVAWHAFKDPATGGYDDTFYTVTITKPKQGYQYFSLLTLGVQAIDHDVVVLNPGELVPSVHFLKPDGSPVPEKDGVYTIDAARSPSHGAIYSVRFYRIACTFTVRAVNRSKAGRTRWAGYPSPRPKNQHDNMPPGGTVEK
ncbi:MAG TPA: hypothetical protein VMM36_10160 [Opitutaceae bacterium]|nr:hypothetical protein [Opitutaceae bacterium]